jgi:hypothetical protein
MPRIMIGWFRRGAELEGFLNSHRLLGYFQGHLSMLYAHFDCMPVMHY